MNNHINNNIYDTGKDSLFGKQTVKNQNDNNDNNNNNKLTNRNSNMRNIFSNKLSNGKRSNSLEINSKINFF